MIDITELLFQVMQDAKYSVIWSFVLGSMYGLICIQCIIPVLFYGGAEGSGKKGLIFGFLFNLPRLVMFFILALIATISVKTIQAMEQFSSPVSSPFTFGILQLITGLILIIFAAELFGVINLDRIIASRLMNLIMPFLKRNFNAPSTHNFGAFIRGFIFSIVCSMESALLLTGIWGIAVLSKDPLFAFLAVSTYGVGNVVSTTLAAGIMGKSTGFLEGKTKRNFRVYVSYLGSMIILFIGLSYFSTGLLVLGLI